MGKTYLNSAEKAHVLSTAAFIAFFEDRIEEWTRLKRPTEQVKYVKLARTYAQKCLDVIFKEIDQTEVVKLLGHKDAHGNIIKAGEMERMEVSVQYKAAAIEERKRYAALDSTTVVDTKDLLEIVSLALASCSVCPANTEQIEACKHRKLFVKYDMEPINCTGEGCPYRID